MKCYNFEFQLIPSLDHRIMCLSVAFGPKGLRLIVRFSKLPRVSLWSYEKIVRKQVEKHIAIS